MDILFILFHNKENRKRMVQETVLKGLTRLLNQRKKKTSSQTVVENFLSVVKTPAKHKIYMNNCFTSYDLFVSLRDKRFIATGTVTENRIAKCPLKSSKILGKMDRGTSDRKFDAKNAIVAVR
ncbi:hypothetical protein AVEN_163145-1 [Araneus ventricosus]|uniref:PiggyBac transposable element-derived protein domain-containing protein n=1 Tax=Araneus ventricosus TaxID=182803 RepID=A0A4Y2DKI2_ARAVE|nr:hypothetical protein AVEN_163145-1 [Araneus ventricosus]